MSEAVPITDDYGKVRRVYGHGDSVTAARATMDLGGASTLEVGTTTGTVAAGNDSRIVAASPAMPSDHSLIAWNMPISAAVAATAIAVAGRIEFSRIRRVPACQVTNLVTLCTAAGSTLTSGQCFAALFTAAGTLVGQTADQAAAWASTGVKTMPLTGGPFTLAAGDYYVGFWFNGTTGPTFARYVTSGGIAAITNVNLSAPDLISGTADTGRTTTAPSSLGTQTGTATNFFVALS